MRSELRSIEEGHRHAQHLSARRALRVCLHGLTQARPPPHLRLTSAPAPPRLALRPRGDHALRVRSIGRPHRTFAMYAPPAPSPLPLSLPSAGGAHCGTVAVAPRHLCAASRRRREPLHLGSRLQALGTATARPSPRVGGERRASRHRLHRLHRVHRLHRLHRRHARHSKPLFPLTRTTPPPPPPPPRTTSPPPPPPLPPPPPPRCGGRERRSDSHTRCAGGRA